MLNENRLAWFLWQRNGECGWECRVSWSNKWYHSASLEENLVQDLIRRGVDQCQWALRKMSSRRLRKRFKNQLSSEQMSRVKDTFLRDSRLDSIGEFTEQLMRKVRQMQSDVADQLESQNEEMMLDDVVGFTATPASPILPSQSPLMELGNRDLTPLEPHQHAKLRRNRRSSQVKSSERRTGSRKRKGRRIGASIYGDLTENVDEVNREGPTLKRTCGTKRPAGIRKGKKASRSRKNGELDIAITDIAFSRTSGSVGQLLGSDFVSRVGNFLMNDDEQEASNSQISERRLPKRSRTTRRNVGTSSSPTTAIGVENSYSSKNLHMKQNRQIGSTAGFESIHSGASQSPTSSFGPHQGDREALDDDIVVGGSPLDQFRMLHDRLRMGGCATLQELIAGKSPRLFPHCDVICAILDLIYSKKNYCLPETEDDICFRLFGADSADRFVDEILLQVTEALMSVSNPRAWALFPGDVKYAKRATAMLLPALARFGSLVERVSCCLLQQLPPQAWRVNRDGFAFVSSVDNTSWRNYIETGGSTPSVIVRFSVLGNRLPRCEIESNWCVLGAAASACPSNDRDGNFAWKILGKMLTEGVLEEQVLDAPPSTIHSTTCLEQLHMFTSIILSGGLDGSRFDDTLLLRILSRTVNLEGRGLRHDEKRRRALFPAVVDEKIDKEFLSRCWSNTGTPRAVTSLRHIAKELREANSSARFMGLPMLAPSSAFLSVCLSVITLWVEQMPNQKSRLKRMTKNMKALTEKLVFSSANGESTSSSNPFSAAFETTDRAKGGSGEDRERLFRSECSVMIRFVYYWSSGLRFGGGTFVDTNTDPVDTIWDMMADQEMSTCLKAILGNNVEISMSYTGDCLRLLSTARMLSMFALMTTGVLPVTDPLVGSLITNLDGVLGGIKCSGENLDGFVCGILACLECSLSCRSSSEVTCCIVLSIGLLLKRVTKMRCTTLRLLLSAFDRLLGNLFSSSFCGIEEDLCLEATLLAVEQVRLLCFANDHALEGILDDKIEALFRRITSSLIESRPSVRTALSVQVSLQECTSHHGRLLVNRNVPMLCKCAVQLIFLVLSRLEHDKALKHLSSFAMCIAHPGGLDNGDKYYSMEVAFAVLQEVSSTITEFPVVRTFILNNFMVFLRTGMEGLLGCSSLWSLPSSNFTRIECHAGIEIAAVELERCKRLQVSDISREIKFFELLRNTVLASDSLEPGAGEYSSFLDGYVVPETDLVPSLEKECFVRLTLLKHLVSFLLAIPWSEDVQCLFSSLLASPVQNLAATTFRLSSTVKVDAKTFEVALAYAELHISLLALIVRSSVQTDQIFIRRSLAILWSSFLCPVLRNPGNALQRCIHETLSKLKAPTDTSALLLQRATCESQSQLATAEFSFIFSHCRSWVIYIARDFHSAGEWKSEGLFHALVVAGTSKGGKACEDLAAAFSSRYQGTEQSCKSQLSRELTRTVGTMQSVEDAKTAAALLALKTHTLFQVLSPRLSRHLPAYGALDFIRNLLLNERFETSNDARFGIMGVCKLVRHLHLALQAVLQEKQPDYTLVAKVIETARVALSIPAHSVHHQASGWLLDWCKELSGLNDAKSQAANYIVAFHSWLLDVCTQAASGGYKPNKERCDHLEHASAAIFPQVSNFYTKETRDTIVATWKPPEDVVATFRQLLWQLRLGS